MKGFVALTGMLCSTLAGAATLFPCDLTLYRKADGQRVSQSSFLVRYNAYSAARFHNPESPLRSLSVRMVEENINIDSVIDSLEARPIDGSFNGMGRFATFVDSRVFGTIECQAPLKKSFFFLTRGGTVFLDSSNDLYERITAPGSCVSGDLNAAVTALKKHWYLPMTDLDHHWTLRADGDGLTWDEVRKEGLDCDRASDMPAPACSIWKETGRTRYHLPLCHY